MLQLLACAPTPAPIADRGVASANVVINELLADRDAGGDWVELYNPGAEPVSLEGYALANADKDETLPSRITLDPGGFLSIACGGPLPGFDIQLDLRLDKDGDEATLTHLDGDTLVVDDHVSWESLIGGASAARFPDGDVAWLYDPTPTPGASNDG